VRHLRPVYVVVDLDFPETGLLTNETMIGPYWSSQSVSMIFFARRGRKWLKDHFEAGHVLLDGEPVEVPRSRNTDFRLWRLVDVERVAHALAQNGYLPTDQLVRVLQIIRYIAESWAFIPRSEFPFHIETREPSPRRVYAMEQEEDLVDDLDRSPGAVPRRFALGGVEYRLDLTEEHWNDLVASLAPYIAVARKDNRAVDIGQRTSRMEIRRWAREHGYKVGRQGPIPKLVERAYLQEVHAP
jgi:hypothetical protein